MKEIHCVPKVIETLKLKLTDLYEKIRGTFVRGRKQKKKDGWEAFGVHSPQEKKEKEKKKKEKHLSYFQEKKPIREVVIK